MPLFEYECTPCGKSAEKAMSDIMKGGKKSVSPTVKNSSVVRSAQIIDLKKGRIEAEAGKAKENGQDVIRYSEDGSTMFVMNTDVFRFSELIYEKGDEKRVKCPSCGSKKAKKVVSSFSFTSDLSTDMPKPDLSNLPPEIRSKVQLKGYIEEKDRPKKNR
ncbi:FmdB family zinc ribbon protein [Candidatus Mycalebacterium sp.]